MEFRFVFYATHDIDTNNMQRLSELLAGYLLERNYGVDVQSFLIGIICVDPKFDAFFKPKRPKYTGERKSYVKNGLKIEVERTLEHEIKLDYAFYVNSDIGTMRKEISLRVLESINDLKKIKRFKALDFDFEAFHGDLKGFMESQGLI